MIDDFESKRDEQGHFLELPPSLVPTVFNSETAGIAVRKRWEKYRQAAADAVTKEMGSIMPDATTPEAAWGVLNARLASQIMDSDKPRGRELQALGQNMGAIPTVSDRSEMENPQPPAAIGADFAALAGHIAQIVSDVLSTKQPIQLHDTVDGTLKD